MEDVLGRYVLQEHVGWRGEAELWRAARRSSPRSLVMIELLESPHDQGKVYRFVERARRAASVNHENVSQVIEMGTRADGAVFVVKEHVLGPSLRRMAVQANKMKRRLHPWFSVYAIRKVLGALADVYDTPGGGFVLHGDIRPACVVVAFDGRIKLSDFGAEGAPSRRRRSPDEEAQDRLGYRPWDRIQGQEARHSHDVYAAAVVLWEALTQRRLFAGAPEDRINQIRQGAQVMPSEFFDDVPVELDAVVAEYLGAQETTAAEMAWALDRVLPQLGGRPTPGGAAEMVAELMDAPSESLPSFSGSTETTEDLPMQPGAVPVVATTEELERRDEERSFGAPHGLYLRSVGGVQIGPRSLTELLSLFVELSAAQARKTLELSVDQHHWFSAARLGSSFGERVIDDSPELPKSEMQGTFQNSSAAGILAEVARRRASGRLVFIRYETTVADRTEITFDAGMARAVASNRHLLFGHRPLLARGRSVPPDVQAAVEYCIAYDEPLDSVAPRSMRTWLNALRTEALEATLVEIMGWPWARFAFVEEPVEVPPAAPALDIFQGLLDWLTQGKDVPVMQAHLARSPNRRLEWTSRHLVEKDKLSLDDKNRERMQRFGAGRTLSDALAACRDFRDEQATLRMAYMLTELGWLKS